MLTKIQKLGNNQGLRINKDLLASANLNVSDEVEIQVKIGALVISPAQKIRSRYKLEDLVARIPEDYQLEEVDWGESTGKEVW